MTIINCNESPQQQPTAMSSSSHDVKTIDTEFVEESNCQNEEETAEEKALVRKIDLFLLPTIWLMYLLSYMDVSISVIMMRI